MNDVVLEVRGGILVEVYSDAPGVRFVLIDWDNIEGGDSAFCWGRTAPLKTMPQDTYAQYRTALEQEDGKPEAP